jgi:hypothetical protein
MIYSSSEQFNHTLKENQFFAEASDCRIWTAMMLANSHFIWSVYLLVICVLVFTKVCNHWYSPIAAILLCTSNLCPCTLVSVVFFLFFGIFLGQAWHSGEVIPTCAKRFWFWTSFSALHFAGVRLGSYNPPRPHFVSELLCAGSALFAFFSLTLD